MTALIIGLANTLMLFLSQRVKFDRSVVGHRLEMPDGKVFTIFRRVAIRSTSLPEPGAFFVVRFRLKNMSIETKACSLS